MDFSTAEFISLVQRLERVATMQESSAKQCDKHISRTEEMEIQVEEMSDRLAKVQETTAVLSEVTGDLRKTCKNLHRITVGLGVLLIVTCILLGLVGTEVLPHIIKLVGVLF